jgi:Protein of unknown function (DUF4435)
MGVQLTVDEAVQSLKNTSLPSLVVEGKDDMTVYRWIERELASISIDIFPVGGRNNVLAVWQRRAEFAGSKVAFLIDTDLELFTGSPLRSKEVILTHGYSIENDVLSTGAAIALMNRNELKHFEALLDPVCDWFAFEVEEHLAGRNPEFYHHLDRLVPKGKLCLCPTFCATRGFTSPSQSLKRKIRSKYSSMLRGKHLLLCYVRCLSHKSRANNTYSADNLLDISTKFPKKKALLNRIVSDVQSVL